MIASSETMPRFLHCCLARSRFPVLLLTMFWMSLYCSNFLMALSHARSQEYYDRDREGRPYAESSPVSSRFVFTRPDQQFSTEFGQFQAVILEEEHLLQKRRFAVGTLIMEPRALLLPHYLNGPCVVYIHRGQAIVSQVLREGKIKSNSLTMSEVHRISAGTPFYVVNAQDRERLQAVLLVDLSDVPSHVKLQSFFLSGGTYPRSVLSGFTDRLLASAFKTSPEGIRDFLWAQREGPILDIAESVVEFEDLIRGQNLESNKKRKEKHYYLFDDKHVFRNQNGWSTSLDGKRYKGFKQANLGMFAVGLKSGSVVAPHWNADVSAIGIVTHGRGRIQIVRADGFVAVNKEMEVGTVFVIPRYHPSSEIAGSGSDFEFIGFVTSSEPMDPQFLAGTNSVFRSFNGSFLSEVFGVTEDRISTVMEAQLDEIILTSEDDEWCS